MRYFPKILIVDDEEPIRKVLGLMVEMEGLEADLAEDGLDALKKIDSLTKQEYSYPLICTDLNMPKMDGYKLINQIIRRTEKEIILPPRIQILTGYNPQNEESMLNTKKIKITTTKKPVSLEFSKELERIYQEVMSQ